MKMNDVIICGAMYYYLFIYLDKVIMYFYIYYLHKCCIYVWFNWFIFGNFVYFKCTNTMSFNNM